MHVSSLDRFELEAVTKFIIMHHQLNDMFGCLNPHALLQNGSHKAFFDALKSMYDNR